MSAVRGRGAVLVAVVVVAGVILAARDLARRSPAAGSDAVVRVEENRHGAVVPPSFLGVSVEWDSVLAYAGPPRRPDRGLRGVLAPVAGAAGAPLGLRIGGDTADQAWWNPSGRPRPPTVLQDVGPRTLDAVGRLARAVGGPVTLGVNLALRDPGNARALAAAARRRLPPGALAALEIGNEPDLYDHGRVFRRGGHVHVRLTKDLHYHVAAYAQDVARYLPVLAGAGARRLVVAGFAGPAWWSSLPALLHAWAPRAGALALAGHLYAVPRCEAATPSAAWLMSPAASRERFASLAPLLAIGRRHHLPVRVDELNSAACGGRPRFSDSPAAALWLADTLFAILRAGAAGADVHTWRGAAYAPFAVEGSRIVARPPLAGMLAFARAAPAGSRLVGVRVDGGAGVRAWATVDQAGTERVALLAPRAAHVVIGGVRPGRCARVWRTPPQRVRRTCAPVLDLPARSMAVVTLASPGHQPGTPAQSPG
jgi:hypothetical protein